ncbi:hypothetical protein [Trichormus sp. NMC-1]|nr:hypothetical protein [Trichormus sp. NMC-1]
MGVDFGYNRIKLPSSYIYTILYNQMEDDFDYLAEQSQIAIVKDRV